MVVFTCSHCGESVQKPKVEKHYETKCRNNFPNLCCIDCLKDFRGDEFKAHTKCVSEAERYGGKGFVAKPNQNKGEKKQNAWIEIVQSVLDENLKLPVTLRSLLERVAQQPNTPRKKVKFINFVKSMDHRTPMKDIESAWDLLSAKLDLLKTCIETKITNGNTAGDKEEKTETEAMQVDGESTLVSPGKKHKKNKKDKKGGDGINGEEKQNGGRSEVKILDEVTESDKLVEKSLSKKEKKEKKKRDKYETQLKEAALPPNDTAIEKNDTEIKKKAKKRRLAQVTEDIANCSIVESNDVAMEKNIDESEPKVKKNKSSSSAFDWTNTILTVLESKGKDVALKKLQKRVLNEYCVVNGVSEIPERITKKFTKTLYKIPNLKITNDKVGLIREDE